METDVQTLDAAPDTATVTRSVAGPAPHARSIARRLAEHASLAPSDRVLIVGSGFADTVVDTAAKVARLTVVEPDRARADATAARLAGSGASIRSADDPDVAVAGSYDAIIVSSARALVPTDLLDRLAPGGRLVMPAGEDAELTVRVTRRPDGVEYAELLEPTGDDAP